MIICIVKGCSWETLSYKRLYDHLSKIHEPLERYNCNVNGCTRNFNVRASFIRHFNKHFSENIQDGHRNIRPDSDAHVEPVGFEVPIVEGPAPPLEHVPINDRENNNATRAAIPREITDKFKLMSVELSLKWLNINTLPRTTVFAIQNDIQNTMIDPLHEALNKLNVTGLISNECKDIMTNLLKNCSKTESEYKFLKRLKELDLYVASTDFTNDYLEQDDAQADTSSISGNYNQCL